MLKSDFLENDLEIVSLPHFVYDFSKKMFLMLYSTDQISMCDCLYFLRYWAICVLQLIISQIAA